MKRTFCAVAAIAGLLFANNLMAQETTKSETKKKKHHMLTISNKGVSIDEGDSTKSKTGKLEMKDKDKAGKARLTYTMFDIGVNMLNDNTVYTDPSVVNYLKVPGANANANLFDLRNSKSININIHPLMVKVPLIKTKKQRLYISTGLGLQIYNFRYEQHISYTKNPNSIILDTVPFTKNKLAVSYINVPLMLTSKTKLFKDTWLVYGVGISAGYRLSSWNKQVSDLRGKVKTRGSFDMTDYNTCITGEFGVEGILRFFASYQLTSLYENGIDQRPISVGIRLCGI